MIHSSNTSDKRLFAAIAKLFRYVSMGLVNTAATYLLYLLLVLFLEYQVAYAISYVSGIALGFLLNSKVVFRTKISAIRMIIYPAVYLIIYAINALLLGLLVSRLGVPKTLAPIMAMTVTVPLGYVLNKLVLTADVRKLKRKATSEGSPSS